MGSRRERGFSVSPEKLEFIECKMRDIGIETREALPQLTGLSIDTIKNIFRGEKVERRTIEDISKALKIEPTEIIEKDRWYRRTKTLKSEASRNIDWQKICFEVLEVQQKQLLTSFSLSASNRRVPDVYVPSGLIERRSKPRTKNDFNPEKFSVREQEEEQGEKIIPISHKDFFDSILKGQSPKSKGKRIAIIGEAGAGKSTLLQKISTTIDGIPIWIDLADLKYGDVLEDYLLQKWLKGSLSVIRQHVPQAVPNSLEPSTELKNAFIELFEQNKVWLLLDGADEMASKLGQPLNWIAQQLRQQGWAIKAKVILTSRLNIWSADGDRLVEFDAYRSLDFEPEDVAEFIDKWFVEEPNSGKEFKDELERSNIRIQSLIRNPLRLTLLCLTWKGLGDSLPETKAGLYKRLVDAHHRWKDDKQEFVLDSDGQELLHQRLGELSKEALDRQASRFRLRQSFIAKFLGNPKKEHSLFWWAIKLNWLIPIGLPSTDENDADESIYTFLHPTFQEYFAALAIDHWHFFFKHDVSNPKDRNYRVFDSQWQEVILLWLGQQENLKLHLTNKKLHSQKEEFINALVKFKDECGGFYQYQTYFIAALSLAEYNHTKTNTIIQQIIKWSVYTAKYYSNSGNNPLQESAIDVLCNTNTRIAIDSLFNEIQDNQFKENLNKFKDINEFENIKNFASYLCNYNRYLQLQCRIIEIVNNIDKNNSRVPVIINDIISKYEEIKDFYAEIEDFFSKERHQVILKLAEIFPVNNELINYLIEVIISEHNTSSIDHEHHFLEAGFILTKIGQNNSYVINALVESIYSQKNIELNEFAIKIIRGINYNHPEYLKYTIKILSELNPERCYEVISFLDNFLDNKNDIDNSINKALFKFIKDVERYLSIHLNGSLTQDVVDVHKSCDLNTLVNACILAVEYLGKNNYKVNTSLVEKLIDYTRETIYLIKIAQCLWRFSPNKNKARNVFDTLISNGSGFDRFEALFGLISVCPSDALATEKLFDLLILPDPVTIENIWLFSDVNNREIIDRIIEILQNFLKNEDEEIIYLSAQSLAKIEPAHPDLMHVLINLLKSTRMFRRTRILFYVINDLWVWCFYEETTIFNYTDSKFIDDLIRCLIEILCSDYIYSADQITQFYLRQAGDLLIHLCPKHLLQYMVQQLKKNLIDTNSEPKSFLYNNSYRIIWHCAQILSYPDFKQAW
jgi:NACHT domain